MRKNIIDILKNSFGNRWYYNIIVILAVILFPVILFNDKISFDHATFVNEWLKITIVLLIVDIILKQRTAIFKQKKQERKIISEFFESKYLIPSKYVREEITKYLNYYTTDKSFVKKISSKFGLTNAQASLATLVSEWQLLLRNYNNLIENDFTNQLLNHRLQILHNKYDFNSKNKIIEKIFFNKNRIHLYTDELKMIQGFLTNFVNEIRRIRLSCE